MLPEDQLQQVKSLRDEVVELRRRLLTARSEVQRLRESPLLQKQDTHSHLIATRRLAEAVSERATQLTHLFTRPPFSVNHMSYDDRGAMRLLLDKAKMAANLRVRTASDLQRRAYMGLRATRSGNEASGPSTAFPQSRIQGWNILDASTFQWRNHSGRRRSSKSSNRKPASFLRSRSSDARSCSEQHRRELEAYLNSKSQLMVTLMQKKGGGMKLGEKRGSHRNAAAFARRAATCTTRRSPQPMHERPWARAGAQLDQEMKRPSNRNDEDRARKAATSDPYVQELLRKAYSDGLITLNMGELARLHDVVSTVARAMYSRGECTHSNDGPTLALAETLAREEAAGIIPVPVTAASRPLTLSTIPLRSPKHRASANRRHPFTDELARVHRMTRRRRPLPHGFQCDYLRECTVTMTPDQEAQTESRMAAGDQPAYAPTMLRQHNRIAAVILRQRLQFRQRGQMRIFPEKKSCVLYLVAVFGFSWLLFMFFRGYNKL